MEDPPSSPGRDGLRELIKESISEWRRNLEQVPGEDLWSPTEDLRLVLNQGAVELLVKVIAVDEAKPSKPLPCPSSLRLEIPLLYEDHNQQIKQLKARNGAEPTIAALKALQIAPPAEPRARAALNASTSLEALKHGKLQLTEGAVVLLSDLLMAVQHSNKRIYEQPRVHLQGLEITSPFLQADDGLPRLEDIVLPGPNLTAEIRPPVEQSPSGGQSSPYFAQSGQQSSKTAISSLEQTCGYSSAFQNREVPPAAKQLLSSSCDGISSSTEVAAIKPDSTSVSRYSLTSPSQGRCLQNMHVPCEELPTGTTPQLWSEYKSYEDESPTLTRLEHRWPGVTKLEHQLAWQPFPVSAAQVDLGITTADFAVLDSGSVLDCDEVVQRLGVQMRDIISESVMREPMRTDDLRTQLQLYGQSRTAIIPSKRPSRTFHLDDAVHKKLRLTMSGNTASAAIPHADDVDQLSTFLQLHSIVSRAHPQARPPAEVEERPDMIEHRQTMAKSWSQNTGLVTTPQDLVPWRRPCQIVVLPQVLAQSEFISQLEGRLPQLMIIERPTFGQSGGQAYRSKDADISISPTFGIIFASLQKLKQRPLPGQNHHNAPHMSIRTTACAYARLLIVIRIGSGRDLMSQCSLREDDCLAIADFMAKFALSTTNIATLCFSGTDADLAELVSVQIREQGGGVGLSAEETRHERLLRTLGYNSYAAQPVLLTSAAQGYVDKSVSHPTIADVLCQRQARQAMCGSSKVQCRPAHGWFG